MAGIEPTPSKSHDWTPLSPCQLSQGGGSYCSFKTYSFKLYSFKLYSFAALQLCSFAALQLCSFTALQLYSFKALSSCALPA
jgi:hypothetical protein